MKIELDEAKAKLVVAYEESEAFESKLEQVERDYSLTCDQKIKLEKELKNLKVF